MDNFLQSPEWARFQEMNGREVVRTESGVYGFVHTLPIVGAYLYLPRFPGDTIAHSESAVESLISLAKKMTYGWVRIEPETEGVLKMWEDILSRRGENDYVRLVKAPHDMQPREIFVIDVSLSEENLLAGMKAKTRYNIRLAEKKGVRVFTTRAKKYQELFFSLIQATAKRQGILPHPQSYYEKMLDAFSEEQLTLFVAEFEGTVLAANLVLFFGDTATYLHGGTSDMHRDVMAPMLLQWEQIRVAKQRGCRWYDFGGVSVSSEIKNQKSNIAAWAGITRFKLGFSPATVPRVFPGCYDMVIDLKRYGLYTRLRFLQQSLSTMKKFLRG